jgi:hypothetical protein
MSPKVLLFTGLGLVILTLIWGSLILDGESLLDQGSFGVVMGVMGAYEWHYQRQYRFTLPVPRPQHALLRGAIRWAMLMVLLALVFWVPPLLAALGLGALPELLALPLRAWVAPLAIATVVFFLFYPVTLHTDQPLPWLLVPVLAFLLGRLLLEIGVLEPVGRGIDGVVRSLLLATQMDRSALSAAPPEAWIQAVRRRERLWT